MSLDLILALVGLLGIVAVFVGAFWGGPPPPGRGGDGESFAIGEGL